MRITSGSMKGKLRKGLFPAASSSPVPASSHPDQLFFKLHALGDVLDAKDIV
jgi:hypothetical protein